MAVNGIEIRKGQQWVDGFGAIVEMAEELEHGEYQWISTDGVSYTSDGIYDIDYPFTKSNLAMLHREAPGVVGDDHQEVTFHALPVVDAMTDADRAHASAAEKFERSMFEMLNGGATAAAGIGDINSDDQAAINARLGTEGGEVQPGHTINPKDAIGSTKIPLNLWPSEASAMGSLGMLEGYCKYGGNNFIAANGVVASIYVAAAKRHLDAWFAGEENAHDTGTPHLANALATIAIIVKCQAHGKLIDDRDYSPQPGGAAYRAFMEKLTPHVQRIKEMFKDKKPRHFTIADVKESA
jgi:hypothetical protein